MKKALFIAFCWLLYGVAFAQTAAPETHAKADTDLVKQHYVKGFHAAYTNSDSAYIHTRTALHMARNISYAHGEAMAINVLGIIHDVTGQYDSSLACYREAIQLARAHSMQKIEAQAFNNIGLIHWNNGTLDSAIWYYSHSAALYKTLDEPRGIANSYNNVGLIYYDQKLGEQSLSFFRDALALYKELGEGTLVGSALNNIGMALAELNQVDSAIHYYKQSIRYRREAEDWYGLSKTLTNLAVLYRETDTPEKAEPTFLEALQYKEEVDDIQGLSSTKYSLASYYFEDRKDYAQALATNTEAVELARSNNYLRVLQKAYQQQAAIMNALGEHNQAYEYLLKSKRLSDSLTTAENTEQLHQLETQYQLSAEKLKNENLTKANEIKELKYAQKRNENTALLVLVALLLLGGVFLVLWLRNRQQKVLQQEMIKQQELGLQAVIQTQEAERKRIAAELHDGIGQLLSGLKLTWNQLDTHINQLPEADQATYKTSTELLDEACSEVRSISHQMMPRALSEAGLVPAVEALLEKTVGHSGINYNFESFGLNDRYPEPVEVGVYRILQEVVGNVLKHARANFFSVQLFRNSNQLVLVVEDNGIGMTKAPKGSGLGLTNIRTRAHSINGVVNFSSGPEGGTLFTLRAPLA